MDPLVRPELRFNSAWAHQFRVEYVFDGNVVVQERWAGDEPWVNYTRGLDLSGTWHGAGGIGGLLGWSQLISGAYRHHYYHADGNGNVTALVNASQKISARYLYDPYGNILASSGGMADWNALRFSSQEFHEWSGLYGYALRFYEPRLGRWLNGDPLREGGGINIYGFVGNDPINLFDAWGLDYKYAEGSLLGEKVYPGYKYTVGETTFEKTVSSVNNVVRFGANIVMLGFDVLNAAEENVDEFLGAPGASQAMTPFLAAPRIIISGPSKISKLPNLRRSVTQSMLPSRTLTVTEANITHGWKVGDPINNLTAEGNIPSWDAVRQRFWKNEAQLNPQTYSGENLARMQDGLAPQRINPNTGTLESMTLHHTPPQRDGGLFEVQKLWPDEHATVDPFYHTGN